MTSVPSGRSPQRQRRIGPFWIEEGLGLVWAGLLIIAGVAILYLIAALSGP